MYEFYAEDVKKLAKRSRYAETIKPEVEEIKKSLKQRVLNEIKAMVEDKETYLIHSLRDCESPIEQLFCLRLFDAFEYYESQFRFIDSDTKIEFFVQKDVEYRGKKYRPDFIIECFALGNKFKFIIECDGHDYHEKTKEQAKRDKSRDRDLQSLGYRVIRFTGSEIWDDSWRCVNQTFDIIQNVSGLDQKLFEKLFGSGIEKNGRLHQSL